MEDEEVVRDYEIKEPDDFVVLVRQRPGKPKKPVNRPLLPTLAYFSVFA